MCSLDFDSRYIIIVRSVRLNLNGVTCKYAPPFIILQPTPHLEASFRAYKKINITNEKRPLLIKSNFVHTQKNACLNVLYVLRTIYSTVNDVCDYHACLCSRNISTCILRTCEANSSHLCFCTLYFIFLSSSTVVHLTKR